MIHPNDPEWREYMRQAANAQAGPYDIFSREAFADAMRRIDAPQPVAYREDDPCYACGEYDKDCKCWPGQNLPEAITEEE